MKPGREVLTEYIALFEAWKSEPKGNEKQWLKEQCNDRMMQILRHMAYEYALNQVEKTPE